MKHAEVAIKCFDMAVNMGPKQANKLAQRAANDCGESLLLMVRLAQHQLLR